MSIFSYLVISVLVIFIILLVLKIYLIKKDLKYIESSLEKILNSDTNNLITTSNGDREVTKLVKSLNKELKVLREQRLTYENGNRELKKNITNISHDMRTPLTAVKGYIDLIKENDDKKDEYLKIIDRKTNDLIDLTESLFDFTKIIDFSQNIKKEKCLINEILEEAIANYYSIFKQKNINPKINICKEFVYRNVNRTSILRAFENILSNISKYSTGNVKISLEKTGDIVFSNEANMLDTSSVEKIFNRYYTVENGQKSNGVGLSIAKELIELNNGKINGRYENNIFTIEIKI